MNWHSINGGALNGKALPSWVILAAVAATAVASATVTATYVHRATVVASATATATVQATARRPATAANSATANSSIDAVLRQSAAAYGQAFALAFAATQREVYAEAGGDATATGIAFAADELGESTANAAAVSVLADAHRIRPGAALGTAIASTAAAVADVTRFVSVTATAGVQYTRAEATLQLDGEGFKRLDGFVPNATAAAIGSVPQPGMAVIATLGSFDFGTATGIANTSFIIFAGEVQASCVATVVQADAKRLARGLASGSAGATANVTAVRRVPASASGTATAIAVQARSRVNHAGHVTGAAVATVVQVEGKKTYFGAVSATAGAELGAQLVTGFQNFGAVQASATAAGTAAALQAHRGHVNATATATGAATARQIAGGFANAQATATGIATAFANSEIRAPADRQMSVLADPRGMIVSFDDRLMLAA